MNAMILGAGRGTRLRDLGTRIPKVLVDICGRPLLQRQLDYLAHEGVQRVIVNAFHLADAVEDFADSYDGPVDLSVIVERELLGTAGGVRNALAQLGSQPFFVLYGDVLVDEPLRPVLDAHLRSGASATITVYRSHEVLGKGLVELDEHDLVVRFVEKGSSAAGAGLINAGLYVIDPAMLEQWPRGAVFDFGFDCFPVLVNSARGIHGFRLASSVVDVGTPEGLAMGRRVYGCS